MAKAKKDILMEFAEKLLEEKNLEGVDNEVQEQLKKDLYERLEDRINAVIIEKLPLEKLDRFNTLVENANEEEIQAFTEENIPELEQFIANELLNFRQTYLGN